MSSAFDKAVADSKKLTSKPSNEDLLKLYGSFSDSPPTPASAASHSTRSPPLGGHFCALEQKERMDNILN